MIGAYCRVSTADQSLERQLEATTDYAENELGAELQDVGFYRDEATGTNTDRSDYQRLMADLEEGVLEAIVVHVDAGFDATPDFPDAEDGESRFPAAPF